MKTWDEIQKEKMSPEDIAKSKRDAALMMHGRESAYKTAWILATPEQLVVLKQLREEHLKSLSTERLEDADSELLPEENKIILLAMESKIADHFGLTGTEEEIREQIKDLYHEDEDKVNEVQDDWDGVLAWYLEDVRQGHEFKV